MKLPKLITVFKVKINYKSGISEVFECTEFKTLGKSLEWKSHDQRHKPLNIALGSVDNIESVWKVGFRKTIIWE